MKSRRPLKSAAGMGALVLTTAMAVVIPAPAAHAAPACNTGQWRSTGMSDWRWVYYPTYNGSLNCELRQGARGSAVVALQDALRRCYDQQQVAWPFDGIFGINTLSALKNAQTWERDVFGEPIAVDGVYGPKTNAAMLWPYHSGQGVIYTYKCFDP
ncbi:hypothetical protein DPM19_01475 [Actinomadura craniellae]|uniref:Peptidoglycan binding-like domain-containing protein n=1 Tax=Actinomadura craniellae TaxID=2231787 RepID=A0A365HCM8_9ACTN|nr:peptidoglycan-binding domain-containing protein [Actinomadura craniellae]RAY16865.1 hypothetical protein DPM19_01475 [Actinomadura craniellae]